ncbi:hypothetical protein BDV37DRAFT_238587 [Aspergillus pseudonomiae]|uniref:Uncharacterized protein n=1 Tax=Aspergillus pseudonomiae TaxID=1506151 RepID=A0A5N7DQ00_9EURO|nr:uncharacterized protein BDV37DRAFT_238587 [Aspergillus pseudonomiae]KAE8408385.1 hypothetical protein BDV37DRAFT_238587 [Aspergillus pseudonomiae]
MLAAHRTRWNNLFSVITGQQLPVLSPATLPVYVWSSCLGGVGLFFQISRWHRRCLKLRAANYIHIESPIKHPA